MNDEDEYDVRAVEVRLARMEAARRTRALANKSQAPVQQQPHVVNGVVHAKAHTAPLRPTVGDFELNAVDSESDSDDCGSVSTSSASEDEGYSRLGSCNGKDRKMRLKDSLDLSMSMSVAWAPEAYKVSKTVREDTEKTHTKAVTSSSRAVVGVEPKCAPQQTAEDREDLFAGKLIRRRRELERQAAHESEKTTQHQRHERHSKTLVHLPEPIVPGSVSQRAPKSGLETVKVPAAELSLTASRLPKPMDVHKDEVQHAHRQGAERTLAQPQARAPTKIQESCEPGKAVVTRPQGVAVNTKLPQSKPDDSMLRREPPVVEAARSVASAVATKPIVYTVPVPSSATAQPVTKFTTKDPIPTNPPTIPPSKKAVAFTVTQSTTAPPQAVLLTSTIAAKPGYARSGNQFQSQHTAPTPQPSVPPVIAAKKEPQEDPEDLIDDLLTAEELRLRESLDKLSSRLNSLTTARETLSRTAKSSINSHSDGKYAGRKQPQPSASVEDNMPVDDANAVRAGSYGGGAHARLHQPTSPTTRASNAKRSELSSGVHKARVRPGGTLLQDAGGVSVPEGGKHKVVLKKDLAHLLF